MNNNSKRNYYLDDIPLEEAIEKYFNALKKYFSKTPDELIDVTKANNRITSKPVFAKVSSPNFNLAAMDGISIDHKNTVGATETSPKTIKIKDFDWIDTGDPINDNHDAVIMIEDISKISNNEIKIFSSVSSMHNVREIGEDLIQSEMIIPENTKINHFDIGVCLAGGIKEIKVKKNINSKFIPTGNELINLGEQSTKGNLIEFNSYVINGLLNNIGVNTETSPIIKDNKELIKNEISNSIKKYDLVIVSAGSSAGSEDYTKEIISELGEVIVHGVSIKPGHPVILGKINDKPVIGLPGYPISAILINELIIKPLIEKKINHKIHNNNQIKAKLTRKLNSSIGEDEFVRASVGKINSEYIAVPLPGGAGVISSIQKANCLIKIPKNIEGFQKNEQINVLPLVDINDIDNTIICSGSHDLVLDLLKSFLLKKGLGYKMAINPIGSLGGLLAIDQNLCHFSGTHIFDPKTNQYNLPFINKFVKNNKVKTINLVDRIQGIIIPKTNPKNIKGIEDLNNPELVFVNRQKGSGTRILFDHLLEKSNINSQKINGYDNEKNSHLAVSYTIHSKNADLGLGIMSSAVAYDLEFIPLKEESFDLVIPETVLNEEYMQIILEIIRSSEFKKNIESIGGYNTNKTGEIIL